MEQGSLQGFIDEAMQIVAAVRTALRALQNDSGSSLAAADLAQGLDRIYRESRQFGMEEVSAAATAAIGAVFDAAASGEPTNALTYLSRLETMLLKKSLEDDYLHLDLAAAVTEEPFVYSEPGSEFEFSASGQADMSAAVASDTQNGSSIEPAFDGGDGLEGFEIDDELLEIFAGEAEELLQNIENSLSALSANPNDKASLWEIRRNAHTFKGSAGIVGLKQISELAHRVEDLLDRLAETSAESNPGILSFLKSSFDCLKALTAGENSPALFHRISQLYYDFDGILAGLEIREVPAITEISASLISTDDRASLRTEKSSVIDSDLFRTAVDEKAQPRQGPARSVVRVSLERLDEMVGIVRDMIIGRSAFEQRLKDLERQIEELHNTTRRLQSTSTKLEVDFGASMLGSDRISPFSSAIRGKGDLGVGLEGFDELEFDNYTDFHQSTREIAEVTNDTFAINTALDGLRAGFETLFVEQRRLIDDLQDKLMRIRIVDFGSLGSRLQRAVRVTCEEEKKKANVVIENHAADVDTQIIDTLAEPLMHLLKNAVVHGIETPEARVSAGKPESGSIRLNVTNEETHIVVTVSDDGRGIEPKSIIEKAVSLGLAKQEDTVTLSDEEALAMIFLPGLSTAEKLNISAGRGVGMSIVKASIEANNGTISIRSTPLSGTTFVIRMPLPLAVTNVLVIESGRRAYALPLKQARQIVEVEEEVLAGSINVAGETVPLISMADRLGQNRSVPAVAQCAVLMNSPERDFALLVEGIRGTEEVVIKQLGSPLDKIRGVLGAAMLGSGELVPIIDAADLYRTADHKTDPPALAEEPDQITVMIVDDSPSVRHLTSKVIIGAGWKPMTAKDGLDALDQLKSASTLPVVILSDIEMPRMDGYEFTASLQRTDEFAQIPVIMITSRTADKHREKAIECGVSKYLTKPYDDKVLLDAIRTLAQIT